MTYLMFPPVDPMFTPVVSDLCSMVAQAQASWAGKQTWQANKANGPARGIKYIKLTILEIVFTVRLFAQTLTLNVG
jgi:hypothetical protein